MKQYKETLKKISDVRKRQRREFERTLSGYGDFATQGEAEDQATMEILNLEKQMRGMRVFKNGLG